MVVTLLFAAAAVVSVPLDHGDPASARFELGYELGAPFDPAKPTVLYVTDGQQFRVAPGRGPELQQEFGDGFNVVGIYGRGSAPACQQAALGPDGRIDWERAWRLFRAEQWVGDLDAVRRQLLGPDGRLSLFGASGGALLVHQYLARHGEHVARAFTSAVVEPWVVAALGLKTDRFWEELSADDRERLARALAARPAERDVAITLLQRQNFFVPLDRLAGERSTLIRTLEAQDAAKLAELRETYQVDAIQQLFDSPRGIAIRVREYEFAVPAGEAERLKEPGLHPDLEVHARAARPLLELRAAGKVPDPVFDASASHRLQTEVLVVAGHGDHTCDWRTSIAVATRYPRGLLFVADDDHMLARMNASGTYSALLRAFLAGGPQSEEFRRALARAETHRWRE
ncbi:MAG TPA: alpha/beta fold hydrolase [Candidatus Polarisedimenticolaceae bacterium]|nr:alpha/beta fold hydrolase [Candidatus Polarisedimenticolaceae bacterium]